MADVLNLRMGIVSITFNSVDLGHTKDGTIVTYEPEYTPVNVDLYGSTPVDFRLKGEKLTAKVRLAEFTLANLKVAIPNGQYAGAANARLQIGKTVGGSLRDLAAQLILHPVAEGTRKYDVVLYKAVVTNVVELPHKVDEDKAFEVEFTAIVDETKADNNRLGLIGDSAA